MKSFKIFLVLLGLATLSVIVYVFDNLITIQEHIALSAHKPIKLKISRQSITIPGELHLTADLYNAPQQLSQTKSLLVVLPSGYWQGGNKKNYAHLAQIASQAGFVTLIPQLPQGLGSIARLFFSPTENILLKQGQAIAQLTRWLRSFLGENGKLHILAVGSGATAAAQLVLANKDIAQSLVLFKPVLPLLTGNEKFNRHFIQPAIAGLAQSQQAALINLWQDNFFIKIKIAILYDEQQPISSSLLATTFAKAASRVEAWQDSRHPLVSLFRLGRKEELLTEKLLNFWQASQ